MFLNGIGLASRPVGSLFSEVDGVGGRGHDLLSGEEGLEDVFVFRENELDEAVGAGGGGEEVFVISHAALLDAGVFEGFLVFADVSGEVVVEVVAEELEDTGFAEAVVGEEAGDFALEVAEGVVEGEPEFPVSEFGATVAVG